MGQPVCRACGSSNVIPDATVYDNDSTSWRPLGITVRLARPESADVPGIPATRDSVTSPLAARVCGECGIVDLYAPDAAQLWARSRG